MKTSITGYLLFRKDNSFSSKYTKISEAGEIPQSLSSDVLYLLGSESKVTGNLVRNRKGDYLLKAGDRGFQTSLFLWDDGSFTLIATGDIFRTQTLLIVYFTPGVQIEIFIAPGMKDDRSRLMTKVLAGKYSEELEALRNSADLMRELTEPHPEGMNESGKKIREEV